MPQDGWHEDQPSFVTSGTSRFACEIAIHAIGKHSLSRTSARKRAIHFTPSQPKGCTATFDLQRPADDPLFCYSLIDDAVLRGIIVCAETPQALLAERQAAVGSVQESFSKDNLHPTIVKGYLAKLVANAPVSRFLESRYPEFFEQFQAIARVCSIMQANAAV